MIKKTGKFLFRNRSYTPIPFIVIMFLFIKPTPLSLLSGFLIMTIGEIIRIWAVSYAGSETRTTGSVGGSVLVTQGPYSLVRNPLYAGNVIIYLGVGVMSMALFPYMQIIAFIYFFFQYYCIIINEEEYLDEAFPETYPVYKKYVSRIFPSFKKLPPEIRSGIEFNLAKGLKSETRTLTSFSIVVILILIFYFLKIKLLTV